MTHSLDLLPVPLERALAITQSGVRREALRPLEDAVDPKARDEDIGTRHIGVADSADGKRVEPENAPSPITSVMTTAPEAPLSILSAPANVAVLGFDLLFAVVLLALA